MKKVMGADGGSGKRRRNGGSSEPSASSSSNPNSTSTGTTTTIKNGPLFEPKQESESMRAFNRRIKEQTRVALKEDMEVLGTSARKKEYLSSKKKQKKLKKRGPVQDDSDSDSGSRWKKRKTDEVEFGEQAERPPELVVRPKMRKKKVEEEEVRHCEVWRD